jgi:hypothetical protein
MSCQLTFRDLKILYHNIDEISSRNILIFIIFLQQVSTRIVTVIFHEIFKLPT